jgi:hypothetical protein
VQGHFLDGTADEDGKGEGGGEDSNQYCDDDDRGGDRKVEFTY